MKQVDDVTNQVVLDLTTLNSPLHSENQETENKDSKEILNSIRRHSFTNGIVQKKLEDFSKDGAVLNGSVNSDATQLCRPIQDGHLTRSISETDIFSSPNKNIYLVPMPNNFSTSVLSNDSCYIGEVASFASVITMSETGSLDSGVYDFNGPPPKPFENEEKKNLKFNIDNKEKSLTIAFQVLLPFLIAGIGTCGAGILLDILQHWTVFENVSELFIVVTPLLGLKGNLEMTLASRLSTQANLGNLSTWKEAWKHGWGNMVLKLAQATIMGLIAAVFAILVNAGNFDYQHALLLCCSCLATATLTTVGLGTVTTTVVVVSNYFNINPDNIATPIAASLGDVTTLGVLALIASQIYINKEMIVIPSVPIGILLILVPLWIYCAKKNIYTKRLILTGWLPIILAVIITSGGGYILEKALKNFEGMAIFQPVMNGVGGNLVAVQASRIATYLHQRSKLGIFPASSNKLCVSPCAAFFGKNDHSRTAIILMLLVIPGHLIFAYSIHLIKGGDTSLSFKFTPIYLSAAVVQVALLLYIAHCMIHWMWRFKIDPDNSAIPFLTALGDLFGTGLLALAFLLYQQVVPVNEVTVLPTMLPNTTSSLSPSTTG